MNTWVLLADKPARLLNLNDRVTTKLQRIDNHSTKAAWRDAVTILARRHPKPHITGRATMLVEFGTDRPNQRRDPHNYFATIKPIADGIVAAGLLGDDSAKHLATVEPWFVTDIRPNEFRVTITWEDPE